MKMTLKDYQDQEYNYPGYCSKCDDIVGSGIEPDADPAMLKKLGCETECEVCGSKNTLYGMECAMMCELIEIEDEEDHDINGGDQSVADVNFGMEK